MLMHGNIIAAFWPQPSFLCHLTIVPSVIVGERAGMATGMDAEITKKIETAKP